MSFFRYSAILLVFFFLTGCLAAIPKGYKPVSEKKDENLYVRYDEFKGVSFTRHKLFFRDDTPIEIYQVNDNLLRVVFTYRGQDWIFFTSATIINSSGEKVSFSFKSYEKETDVLTGGSVFESIDIVLTDSEAKKLLEILSDPTTKKIRLSGSYYKDYTLMDNKVLALQEIIKNIVNPSAN